MKDNLLCDPYVWEHPRILLYTSFYGKGKCVSELVNHIILIYLVAYLGGSVLSYSLADSTFSAVSIALATIWCLPAFFKLIRSREMREGFQGNAIGAATDAPAEGTPAGSAAAAPLYNVIGAAPATLTLPTARNPFMNVLLDEIKYHPTRPMAASVLDPSVKVGLDDFFRAGFYSDPTDVFGRSQSQRQFITMPSTSIPNDVDSYQKWLYGIPGKTCKEGGREACLPGTDGGPIPWLNVNP
jgi:hypothetical protein